MIQIPFLNFKRHPQLVAQTMIQNGQTMIQLNNVVKTYTSSAGEFTVLKGINLSFKPGEFVGVVGKSGSGKSTLLNMITGIDRPTSGEIIVAGTPIHKLSEGQMSVWRGKNLGIVFQFFQLLPTLSLVENVMLPMDFCNLYAPRERKDRAMELLEMVEMQEHAYKLPSAISGGQQQRVAIARSLANDPPIIIADEPTGNLDSRTADAMFTMFEALVNQGKTMLMVTHDASLARRFSRTVLISDGEVVNQWVFSALPTLSHLQMLKATKNLKPLVFESGETIIRQGETCNQFYIIASGEVEVVVTRPNGAETVVNRMGPGQYFGEIELLKNQNAIATIRANGGSVEVVSMSGDFFENLISDSQSTRDAVFTTAYQRIDENTTARGYRYDLASLAQGA